ncbi:MAG: hypothetical protein OXP66_11280, partial [Candidatus Tectomicrobia bacterium]|nr:hypothetical protein [Candidatus Tectomicrobia bacterium]
MNASNGMKAVHPGEILRREVGLSANMPSKALVVSSDRVTMTLNRQRGGGGPRLSPAAGETFR